MGPPSSEAGAGAAVKACAGGTAKGLGAVRGGSVGLLSTRGGKVRPAVGTRALGTGESVRYGTGGGVAGRAVTRGGAVAVTVGSVALGGATGAVGTGVARMRLAGAA